MESVTIKGVEYVKASILAKRYRYTSDYIGQLCRGRKVDAKLVGRTWYVNELSLEDHKSTRHAKNSPAEKLMVSNIAKVKSRIDVHAIAINKSPKSNPAFATAQTNFARRLDWQPLRYENDTEDLLPNLHEPKPPVRQLRPSLAEPANLKVILASKATKYVADALPQVSLTGQIMVRSINTVMDSEEASEFNTSHDMSIDRAIESESQVKPTNLLDRTKPRLSSSTNSARAQSQVVALRKVHTATTAKTSYVSTVKRDLESESLFALESDSESTTEPKFESTPQTSRATFTPTSVRRGAVLEVGRYHQPDSGEVELTNTVTKFEWGLRILLLVSILVLLAVLFLEQSSDATSQAISSALDFNF